MFSLEKVSFKILFANAAAIWILGEYIYTRPAIAFHIFKVNLVHYFTVKLAGMYSSAHGVIDKCYKFNLCEHMRCPTSAGADRHMDKQCIKRMITNYDTCKRISSCLCISQKNILTRWRLLKPNDNDIMEIDLSTLLQVMAWCCPAPSHYLNQWYFSINMVL